MNKKTVIKTTYDKIAEIYSDTYFDRDVNTLKNVLIDFTGLIPKKSLMLDVGSGTGNFTKHFLGKGYKVISIDISDGMLTVAKRNVPEGDFRKMDAISLDFPENYFDAVFLKSLLVNIEKKNVPNVLEEVYRVLKPNGLVLISIYIGKGEHVIDEPLKPCLKMLFNFYSQKEAEKTIKSSGLNVMKVIESKYKEDLSEYYEGKFLVFFCKK